MLENLGAGVVVSIHITPVSKGQMVSIKAVKAVKGRGLEGDRYFYQVGTFSHKPAADREVTLIEIEAIVALARDYGIELSPGNSRRNIVTKGFPLNHLVGRKVRLGEATLLGIRLCEPCSHLERLTQKGVRPALVHRGGLRAQVLTNGLIQVGDPIRAVD